MLSMPVHSSGRRASFSQKQQGKGQHRGTSMQVASMGFKRQQLWGTAQHMLLPLFLVILEHIFFWLRLRRKGEYSPRLTSARGCCSPGIPGSQAGREISALFCPQCVPSASELTGGRGWAGLLKAAFEKLHPICTAQHTSRNNFKVHHHLYVKQTKTKNHMVLYFQSKGGFSFWLLEITLHVHTKTADLYLLTQDCAAADRNQCWEMRVPPTIPPGREKKWRKVDQLA